MVQTQQTNLHTIAFIRLIQGETRMHKHAPVLSARIQQKGQSPLSRAQLGGRKQSTLPEALVLRYGNISNIPLF